MGTVQTAHGYWVNVNWNGEQLNVNNDNGYANRNVGACSVRYFLLSRLMRRGTAATLRSWKRLHPSSEHTANLVDHLLQLTVFLQIDHLAVLA